MHPKVGPLPGPQGTKVVSRGSTVATVHIAILVQDELECLLRDGFLYITPMKCCG
jgi:hypothetical protein